MGRSISLNRRHVLKPNRSVDRWTEWARAFSDKRRHMSAIRQRPSLVLRALHGSLRGHGCHSRWVQVVQQLFLRIVVGIHATPEKNVVGQGMGRSPQGPIVQSVLNQVSLRERPLQPRKTNAGGGPVGVSRGGSVSPIERTFARAEVVMDTDGRAERRAHATTCVVETCHRLARQIIQRCERMEERRTLSCVLRREGPAAASIRSEGGPDESTRTSPWGLSAGKPGFAMSPPQASIDLNRLTDQVVRQIDSRMVAYRERMGNVF